MNDGEPKSESPLDAFFAGAYEMLRAAFTASERLSNASKGAVREMAARDLLQHLLPHTVRIESGDIIDVDDRQSGQLDGVVVDQRSPTLKLSVDHPAVIFAEGVLAVLEIKSNVSTQVQQVKDKYEKIAPLRPRVKHDVKKKDRLLPITDDLEPETRDLRERINKSTQEIADRAARRAEEHREFPFVIVGGRGWKVENQAKLIELCRSLAGERDTFPPIYVFTLEPPAVAALRRDDGEFHAFKDGGDVMANLWYVLVESARRHADETERLHAFRRYFGKSTNPPVEFKRKEQTDTVAEAPAPAPVKTPA
jgi:hypothetical protein